MTTENEQLLNCPFCGSIDYLRLSHAKNYVWPAHVICEGCGANGPLAGNNEFKIATDKWNTRAEPLLSQEALRTILIEAGTSPHIAGALSSIVCAKFAAPDIDEEELMDFLHAYLPSHALILSNSEQVYKFKKDFVKAIAQALKNGDLS